MWMAKLADKGKISCIFFADTYGGTYTIGDIYLNSEIWCQIGHETYQEKADAAYRSGGSVGQTDPTVWVSAMAAVSKNVSFGITGSTSYINVHLAIHTLADCLSWLLKPFILARTWSTLDHATQGRVAWNMVTSYSNASAKAMGKGSITPKHLRYEEAHEYMDLCYS
jgi:alkanesulfonate monooxygenase SsuD/methylene tetrahydromethanopterin reductase-like flavin-dependent oxidoreductase (luciferase family)